jgi:GntR family transcriptional regulator/MocR family aminotransferase
LAAGPDLHLQLPAHGPRRAALETALREAIRDGRLASGARLPSTRALAADLGLARGTVVEAFAQLEAEGYLTARRGSGTRVGELELPAASGPPRRELEPQRARFSLHSGVPDLASFPRAAWLRALRRGLQRAPAASLGYGDPRGRRELREELAWYLARVRGVDAEAGLVVVTAGFRHGLALLCRALAAHGVRSIAMEDPCAPPHLDAARGAGLSLVSLPVDERGARTDLLAAGRAPAAVLAPAHQFPLGSVLQPERRAAALAWAAARGGLVVEDDYDAELRYDRQPVGALQALAPDLVAYGGTASKTLAPALRLGWLVLPERLLEPVLELRRAEDAHVPAPEQLALCELLRSGEYERHVRRMRARYRRRRDRLLALLARRVPALEPRGISAGLGVVLELPQGGPSAAAVVAAARERSLAFLPLSAFAHDGRGERQGIVIGYGAPAEHELEAAFGALGDVLAEML